MNRFRCVFFPFLCVPVRLLVISRVLGGLHVVRLANYFVESVYGFRFFGVDVEAVEGLQGACLVGQLIQAVEEWCVNILFAVCSAVVFGVSAVSFTAKVFSIFTWYVIWRRARAGFFVRCRVV